MTTLRKATVKRLYEIARDDPVMHSVLSLYEARRQDFTFEQALLTIAIALAEQKAVLIKQLEVVSALLPPQFRITRPDEDIGA